MRFTPLFLTRAVVATGACALAVILLEPSFQGLEQRIGLSDKAAHALAFYGATLGLFVSFPNVRRIDLALVAAGFAALTEIAQAFTGRSASFADAGADIVGVAIAVLPGLAQSVRYWATGRSRRSDALAPAPVSLERA
jgi:VanZ family protein